MAKLYPALIDQATGGKLRRLLRAHPQAGGLGLSAPLGREVEEGRIRIGIVYGGFTAATYSGLAMTAAGVGEVKFHKIKHDGSAVVELEDEAEKAFSLSQTALADGLEVLCFRDQTITDPANPHTPQPGWIAVPLSKVDPIQGAFRMSGSVTPVTTASGTNQHHQFVHNDAECYEPIPHATIADTWHGVEIVRTGRHWISAYLEVNIASPPANDGTILMTDGVDLFSKVNNIQGTFALTANDGLGSLGDGAPALDSVIWTALVFLAMNVHITFPGRMFWLEEGVQLQLFHHYPAAVTGPGISISYGFSGFYYGDFGTAWDPDAETP